MSSPVYSYLEGERDADGRIFATESRLRRDHLKSDSVIAEYHTPAKTEWRILLERSAPLSYGYNFGISFSSLRATPGHKYWYASTCMYACFVRGRVWCDE